MSDIVERLNSQAWGDAGEICTEAAAEIGRNRAAIDELVVALKAIVDLDDGDKPDLWHFESEFAAARAAIAKHESVTICNRLNESTTKEQ